MGPKIISRRWLSLGVVVVFAGCGQPQELGNAHPNVRLEVLPYLAPSSFVVMEKPTPLDRGGRTRVKVRGEDGQEFFALVSKNVNLAPGQKISLTMLMIINRETPTQIEYWRLLVVRP